MAFEWIPGHGMDADAIERMERKFRRPKKPSYEAWFMSGNIHYHYWLFQPIGTLTSHDLTHYLYDTCGGIMNFGRREEWVGWFHYLLPYLLPRFRELDMLELMMNYIFNLYPDGLIDEYPGFRADILATLPQAIMSSDFWQDGDLSDSVHFYELWGEFHSSHIFCSLFFCLRYLTPDEIVSWVASIAAVKGKIWRSTIWRWLDGLQTAFDLLEHPEYVKTMEINKYWRRQFGDGDKNVGWYLGAAGIGWDSDNLVFNGIYAKKRIEDYLPPENVKAFWREIESYSIFTEPLE